MTFGTHSSALRALHLRREFDSFVGDDSASGGGTPRFLPSQSPSPRASHRGRGDAPPRRWCCDPEVRRYRFLRWSWIVLAAVLLATGGKPYYLGGLLPVLLAAGATPVDRWLKRGRRGARRAALVALSAIASATVSLPILPVDTVDDRASGQSTSAPRRAWTRIQGQTGDRLAASSPRSARSG